MISYGVIVIGGGHAGCEAALSAARNGVRTLLVSVNMDSIASMPFGGTIGGPGRGQLVREVDALGGEISKNTDKNYINIRNVEDTSGPCERIPQAVVDRRRYFLSMKEVLEKQKYLDLRQGLATEVKENKKGFKLFTSDETVYLCRSLVICGGTFLRGRILWGENLIEAGRQGEISSKRLPSSLESLSLRFERIKIFTAPMIDRKTIDFNKLEKEPFESYPEMFSSSNSFDGRVQLNNYIVYIEKNFISFILKNINVKKGYSRGKCPGRIRGRSSIEGRVLKSGKKEVYKIFIQPTGRGTNELYVQGLETMLPEEIQEKMLKKIKGLEEVQITRPGYAVEYDFLRPSQINRSLESRIVNGIFFAGKMNGTTGYEEDAAQGIIAGINAARNAKDLESTSSEHKDGYIDMLLSNIASGEISLKK